jgi:hypothetical protein
MREYENWLQAYMWYTRASESPDNFHFWTGVATVAGALRRRVWVDEHLFQWTPNFYIILVGPPGVAAKSTSIRQGLNLLEKAGLEADSPIQFGPQSMTWQALTVALEKAGEGVEIDGEIHPMSCLTISISELGTFLDPKNDELTSTLIAMWDGQKETWRRETKTSGNTEVINPWLNVIGCTTPSWIKTNMPLNMIGGGLTSRILFVYGEHKRHLVAFPSQATSPEDHLDTQRRLISDLTQIANLKGEYKRSAKATEWGVEWYRKLYEEDRPSHMQSDRYEGYIARKQSHLFKIAIVLAATKRNDLIITDEDLAEADGCLLQIEKDMGRVFASIGATPEAQKAGELLALIRNAKGIDYQKLFQIAFQTMSQRDFIEAMKGLRDSGKIKAVKTEKGQKIYPLDV